MGETHALGPLEMRVLGLLGDEALAVAMIQARLAAAGVDLAYTTVMTVLARLHKKGLAQRTKDGNRYLYSAAKKAPKVSVGILARASRALFDRDRAKPILALIDESDLTADELAQLRRAIDDKLGKKRS